MKSFEQKFKMLIENGYLRKFNVLDTTDTTLKMHDPEKFQIVVGATNLEKEP